MLHPKIPFLEIIEWVQQDPNIMMWKIPDSDREIKNGAKLIVRDSQSAMLLNEGKMADIFAPGLHSLSTENVPILSRLKGWKYGFESPYKADIYFFSVKQFVNLKWGTPAPIMMRDPHFGQVRVRGFGTYNVRISDAAKFFKEYAGSFPVLYISAFERQLRDFIAPKFGEVLASSNISVLDISKNLSVINAQIAPLITPYFEAFGIEITQFTMTSATLPEEVNTYYDKVTGMNMIGDMGRFQQFNTAVAISQEGNPANNGAQQGLALGMIMDQMGQKAAAGNDSTKTQQQEPGQASTPKQTNEGRSVKEQLTDLKQLFDEGLIDEQEFKDKKATILSRI